MNIHLFFKKNTWILMIGFILFWSVPGFSAPSGTVKWGYETDGAIVCTPAVGLDGTIYFGSRDDYIYALNPGGSLKWKYNTGYDVSGSPVIGSDGTVYCGSDGFNFYALNSDGSLKWKFKTVGRADEAPVLGPDGIVYFGDDANRVYALNSDGTLKWKYLTGGGIGVSDLAMGLDGTIYFSCGNWDLYALYPNGTLKWKYLTGGSVESSPVIDLDGTIYIGSRDDYIHAVNPNGTLKWKFKTDSIIRSSPAVGIDGTVFCGSADDYIYAVNPNGTLKWKFKTGNDIWSTPVIGLDGTIYCASHDKYFYALNANGTLKWNYGTGDNIYASPVLGMDGTFYCGSDDTYMYAINNSMNFYYCMPVFKPQSSYWSGLGITNLSNGKPANVAVTVYSQAGTILKNETQYIPAHGQSSFLIGTALKNDGWIKISSSQPISGMNLMGEYKGTSTDYYLADVPFISSANLAKLLVVPHVAQNSNWDTIVYLANPNATGASVTLTYVSKDGAGSPPSTVSIPFNGSKEISLNTITSTSGKGGYVIISSTEGLTAFALYNNLKTGNYSYAGIRAVDVTKQ